MNSPISPPFVRKLLALAAPLMLALPGLSFAGGIETLIPSPIPRLPSEERPGIAFGSDWIAHERWDNAIGVVNRATSQEILSIPDVQNEPVEGQPGVQRSFVDFGRYLAADGNRLAMISRSWVGNVGGYSLAIWEIPSGQRIATVDLGPVVFGAPPFVGMSDGRVVVAGNGSKIIRSWSAENLTPYPDITIPDGLPEIPSSINDKPPVGFAGDHLVFYTSASSEETYVVANLETRQLTTLAGVPVSDLSSSFALNHDRLIIAGWNQNQPVLVHYDFTTSTFGPVETQGSGTPVISEEGIWHAFSQNQQGRVSLISGTTANANPAKRIDVEWLAHDLGEPLALVDGALWLRPLNMAPRGTVAIRMALGGIPETVLKVTPQPANESDGVLTLQVTASSAPTAPVSFRLTTADASALAGSDYTALDQTFTLPAGSTSMEVGIPLLQDRIIERGEAFHVRVSELSSNALIARDRMPCTIGGAPFHLIPPLAPWTGGANDTAPADLALAGGHLVQMNSSANTSSTSPVIVRKPFDSGEWEASTSWGRSMPQTSSLGIQAKGTSDGKILIRELNTASVYQPATDQVIHRVSGNNQSNYNDAITTDRFATRVGATDFREHFFNSALPIRQVPRPWGLPYAASYTPNLLIQSESSGVFSLFSRADGSAMGEMRGPFGFRNMLLSTDGNLAATFSNGRVFFCHPEGDQVFREIVPPEGRFTAVRGVKAADGLIFVEEGYSWLSYLRVFDPVTGADMGKLFNNYYATRLPGAPIFDQGIEWTAGDLGTLHVEGDHAAVLCKRTHYPTQTPDHHIFRFSKSTGLPGLATTGPVNEGEPLTLSFTEAVDYPVTVSARIIPGGRTKPEDWMEPTAPVIVPAGVTSFATNLSSLANETGEDPSTATIEVTLTAGNVTQVRRLVTQHVDDDRMLLADVPSTSLGEYSSVVSPFGEGWLVRAPNGNAFTWTEDSTLVITPKKAGLSDLFGWESCAATPWFVTSEYKGTKKGFTNPRLQVYRPGDGPALVRSIKRPGKSREQVMCLLGDVLWATSPPFAGPAIKANGGGIVHEYGLPKGKVLRTYLAPRPSGIHFGRSLAAHAQFLWVGEPANPASDPFQEGTYPVASRVLQYSCANGSLVREVTPPAEHATSDFGRSILTTGNLLIVSTKNRVLGFDAVTGGFLWAITVPEIDTRPTPVAYLDEDILAIGKDAITLYRLVPGGSPEFIKELMLDGDELVHSLAFNRNNLAVTLTGWTTSVYDLTSLIAPQQPVSESPLAMETPDREISFTRQPLGWLMDFGSDVNLVAPPGTELTLESSTDLDEWETVARRDSFAGWIPVVEWLSTGTGNSLKIQREDTARYFRMRLSPVDP